MNIESPDRLSDAELLARTKSLVKGERHATVTLVAHLAEIDARKLYLDEGSSSLFTYCTQVLHLSEHAAYNRIEAARAARRFPVILELLRRGDVHLTTVKLLAGVLTPENHRSILEEARHQSRAQIEVLVARLRPQPDVAASIRKLPKSRRAGAKSATSLESSQQEVAAPQVGETKNDERVNGVPPVNGDPKGKPENGRSENTERSGMGTAHEGAQAQSTARSAVTPIAPGRYKITFPASAETREKLRRVQDLLGHQIPKDDLAAIMDRALGVLLRDLEKQKLAATDRPRPSRASRPGSRHIPAAVKRAVWERDGGRCTFVGRDGRRCSESRQLEFHHLHPHGDGGPAIVSNVQMHCRRHNRYEADRFYRAWRAENGEEFQQEPGEDESRAAG